MNIVRLSAVNNPYYPLPPDYPSLTPEGQRLARVNGCRQWIGRHNTREEKAHAFVSAIRLFDHFYLRPDEEANFDPGFYDDAPLADAPGHIQLMRRWGIYKQTLGVCPRGFAKSTKIRIANILRLLSRPDYSIIYATSTHDNAQLTGQVCKNQIFTNERIHNDWASLPEFGGRIRPLRGEASVGVGLFYLTNGSWMRSVSSESMLRGGRPRRFVLDDPESDPKASTSMEIRRSNMFNLIFRVIVPMLSRPDVGVDWLATFISRRHYAWHAMEMVEDATGLRAKDPLFDNWSRLFIDAITETPDGKWISCWPEMWPATRAERLALSATQPQYEDHVSLEEIKEAVGTSVWNSEYRGRPGEAEEQFFGILTSPRHGWVISNADGLPPHRSRATLQWTDPDGSPQSVMLENLRSHMRVFVVADTSHTATKDSDFKTCGAIGVTSRNEMFCLDLWAAQTQENQLVTQCFRMADDWRAATIHCEAIREGFSLFSSLETLVRQRATDMAGGVSHLPGIRKIDIGTTEKTARIASLHFRFEHGLIKLPLHRRADRYWSMLFDQIEGFNPYATDGGLAHDDAIEILSHGHYVIRSRPPRPVKAEPKKTLFERLRSGETHDATGEPLGNLIHWAGENPRDVQEFLHDKMFPSLETNPDVGTLA